MLHLKSAASKRGPRFRVRRFCINAQHQLLRCVPQSQDRGLRYACWFVVVLRWSRSQDLRGSGGGNVMVVSRP
jgi:hypothetical protein